MWLENPLQIRRPDGIKRDKSDRTEPGILSCMPAATGTGPNSSNYPEASLKSPELLLSFRERLLQNKHSLLVSSAKIRSMIKKEQNSPLYL